jgi:hypothetical protein
MEEKRDVKGSYKKQGEKGGVGGRKIKNNQK